MIKISVILPVYNRESVVSRMLQSMEIQTFKDFELVIVNDGSTDDTLSVCKKFCSRNVNWKVFDCEHMGISESRKFGLSVAKGEYISFVDSDDFVEKDFLKVLYDGIQKHDRLVDISICNYNVSYEGFFKLRNFLFHKHGIYDSDKILKCMVSDISVKSFLWNKLFKKELFKNIIIPKIPCYEDKIICIQLLFNSKKCYIDKRVLYNYVKNPKSIMWKTNEQILDSSVECSKFIKKFFKSKDQYKNFEINHKIFCVQIFFIILDVSFFKCIIRGRNIFRFFSFISEKCKSLSDSTEKLEYENINLKD